MDSHLLNTSSDNDPDPSIDFFDEEQEDLAPPSSSCGGATAGQMMLGALAGVGESDNSGGGSAEYGASFHQPGGVPEELEKNLDDASNLLDSENEQFQQRMWSCFQNCARAVAQVYMSNKQPTPSQESRQDSSESRLNPTPSSSSSNSPQQKQVEESFKSAAQHATSLYKDSIETSRRLTDLAIKTGSNRRTKEILSFVKSKKKRFIKKDELISFLIGCSSGSSGGSGKKDNGGTGGTRSKHAHFGGGFNMSVGPGGLGIGFFEGVYPVGNTSLPHYHVHQQPQGAQLGSGFGSGGVGSVQQQSQFSCSIQQQPASILRDSCSFDEITAPSSTSSSNSGILVRSGIQPSLYNNTNPSPRALVVTTTNDPPLPSTDDPSLLHLAVQQLFVAGIQTGNPPSEFQHVAGVKRPAQDKLMPVKGDSLPRRDENSNNDEDDSMMEDGVDVESTCNFKRMRFY